MTNDKTKALDLNRLEIEAIQLRKTARERYPHHKEIEVSLTLTIITEDGYRKTLYNLNTESNAVTVNWS